MNAPERTTHYGFGLICVGCGFLVRGVVLRDEVGHWHTGCHPWAGRPCNHCDDPLDPTEAVEWEGRFWHADCREQAKAWLEDCMDSDTRSFVQAVRS